MTPRIVKMTGHRKITSDANCPTPERGMADKKSRWMSIGPVPSIIIS